MKGINLFRKTETPILGLINNMALFECPSCHQTHKLFGHGTRMKKICEQEGIKVLAELPVFSDMGGDQAQGSDHSWDDRPMVVSQPGSEGAKIFRSVTEDVLRFAHIRRMKDLI